MRFGAGAATPVGPFLRPGGGTMVDISGRAGRVIQKKRERHDGWTPARRTTFLTLLAATCNVKEACRAVGKQGPGVYALRLRDPEFDRQWAAALEQGYARLETELLRRALDAMALGDPDLAPDTDPDADGAAAGSAGAEKAGAGLGDLDGPPMDVRTAMTLLAQRDARLRPGRGAGREWTRLPSRDETNLSLERKLAALERMRATAGRDGTEGSGADER